ncbi:hypothetical protein G9P44_001337 [Scheffersomyces stipitis]|nr:hypothetical protein G9P44_001337 [Scheffersomyces stipitis]
MSVVTLTKESHKDPTPFRIKHDMADHALGPNAEVTKSDELPTLYTSSKVAIIGGGFGGMATAMTLKEKLGEDDFVIFERYDNFGGTWYVNTYPGCASDIPALWYSFSNELNSNWTRIQPPQYEMEEYILKVAEKHQLKNYAKFKSSVTKIQWNDDASNWTVYVRNEDTGQLTIHTAKVVVACSGGLVYPKQFEAKGLEDFGGKYMHSALWDHSVDFKNKKVVVIGNGCSGNQVIPALLKDYNVKSITQVVRSAHYVSPPIPSILLKLYHLLSFSRLGLLFWRWIFAKLIRSASRRVCLKYMKTAPEKYHKILIPDFKLGCKRLIFDYNYIPSLHDPRIELRNDPIDHVSKKGLVMKSGEVIEADIIVACTGYVVSKSFHAYEIIGRNGTNIGDIWYKQGASAYNTISVRDCPNFFTIGGPNSATGHSSVVMAIENGCTYMSKFLPKILDNTYKYVVVKTDKYNEYFETIQKRLKSQVFGSAFGGCASWYTENGVNSTAYAYSQIHYWWKMNHPDYNAYEYVLAENKKTK